MTTHPDYLAMLDGVLAAPQEDAPRLVLADWLEERGETERAEFIRVQCELAKWPVGAFEGHAPHAGHDVCIRGTALRRREQELLTPANIEAWAGDLFGDGIGTQVTNYQPPSRHHGTWLKGSEPRIDFRRGFVAEIRCKLGDFYPLWCERRQRSSLPCAGPEHSICPICHGTGTTPGLGCEIVRACPIERVVVTDREPDDAWWWWRDNGEFTHNPAYIPSTVFDHIESPHVRGKNGLHFDSAAAAHAALSAALLAWSKNPVGRRPEGVSRDAATYPYPAVGIGRVVA